MPKEPDWDQLRSQQHFEPKLDFPTRCAILALHHKGVTTAILAAAFKVHRRTIVAIFKEDGSRYKDVRERRRVLGPGFEAEYVKEEHIAACFAVKDSEEVRQSDRSYNRRSRAAVPNMTATKYAGMQVVKAGSVYDRDYTIVIEFEPVDGVKTWGYRVLDSENPTYFHHRTPISPGSLETKPFNTSAEAYEDALKGGISW